MTKVIVSAKRPAADIIETLRALVATEAGHANLVHAAKSYRGGQIFPFEYDVVTAVRDSKDLDEAKAAIASIDDNPTYFFPFAPGDRVVALCDSGDSFRKGDTLIVDTCYVSEGWGGQECYVRFVGVGTPNEDGTGAGHGYASFIKADEFAAIKEARAGGGYLVRLESGKWSRPITGDATKDFAPDITQGDEAVVLRLIERGVFRGIETAKETRVALVESVKLIEKCGFGLTKQEQVEQAVRRVLAVESDYGRYVDYKDDSNRLAGLSGLFPIDRIAGNLIVELGL